MHAEHLTAENAELLSHSNSAKHIQSESRLSFYEATSIIVGHGVGAGILSVPYLASSTRWWDILWIIALAFSINLLMHYMIAELSYNNDGLQFIKCLERELFVGKFKQLISYSCFALLFMSVMFNVSGYISGASAVFAAWFHMDDWAGILLFYALAAAVVYFGMKIVGICEKIAVSAMFAVIIIILVAALLGKWNSFPQTLPASRNLLGLYSIIAFSLSAVMSVPQVVKGLDGDIVNIRRSIALGTGLNAALILVITFTTLLGARVITQNGALTDLSLSLGGWVAILGYLFSLLALSTSFWANTLNLRDVIAEQTKLKLKISWFIASFPCLLIALIGTQSFVALIRLASLIQIVTGLAIIVAYNRSRKKNPTVGSICGKFGGLGFQLLVVAGSIIATLGSLVKIVTF